MKQSFRDTVTKKVNNDIYNVSHKNVEYREKSYYDLVVGDLVWVCVPILPTVQVNKKYMITKEALDDWFKKNSGKTIRYVAGNRTDRKALYKSFTAKTERELKHKIKEYNEDRTKYTVKTEATSFQATSFRDYEEFWMRTVKYPILKPVSYDRLE